MKNYYATACGNLVTEDIYEGGVLRYEAHSQPYLDLWNFSKKQQRDEFVSESEYHSSITVKEINKQDHLKQQLIYMGL